MPDNIDRYVPEFDEEGTREKLSAFEKPDLMDMLVRAYGQTRLAAKMADDYGRKLERIAAVTQEPSSLLNMPDVPGPDDLRKMME